MNGTKLAVVLAAAMGTAALAQRAAPLQVGELLMNGADQQVKVLQCKPVSYGRECETVLWENGKPGSNPAWWDEEMLVKGDARVRAALGRPPRAGTAVARPAAKTPPAARPAPAGGTRIPDGSYACQMWMGNSYVSLGRVRSVGGKLAGNPLAKAGATITGVAPTAKGITISYTTARGYRESMDCER